MVPETGVVPKIWVDADATPRAIKEVLVKISQRWAVEIVFVANRYLEQPRGSRIRGVVVGQGADVADEYIATRCGEADLVITADVPLAARAVERGSSVLQPHGKVLDAENVGEALAFRDLADSLRETGIHTGGPPPFSGKDKTRFANAIDRWLAGNAQRN